MTFNPTGNPSLGASPCHSGHVQSSRRWELLGQRPVTIWLTGLECGREIDPCLYLGKRVDRCR